MMHCDDNDNALKLYTWANCSGMGVGGGGGGGGGGGLLCINEFISM